MQRNLIRWSLLRYFNTPEDSGGGTNGAGGDTGSNSGDDAGKGSQFTPITSQDDLNKIIADRVSRERSKYGDYKDLKTKAAEFDKITEANKSEIQKAADARVAVEKERDDARAEALRLRIAAKNHISDEDADLFLTGRDEETLNRQAARLADRDKDRRGKGNRVSNEGTNPTPGARSDDDGMRDFTRQLFHDATVD